MQPISIACDHECIVKCVIGKPRMISDFFHPAVGGVENHLHMLSANRHSDRFHGPQVSLVSMMLLASSRIS